MLEQGVISPVTPPTEWCAGIVPVLKPNGKVRICVDLTELNKAVQLEVHPMPSVDESLAKLGNSKIFSKLDANSGFLQIPLDEESRLLTTFVTPFGRYCFNRLPFGISSAPEIFQRTMSRILEGLDGTICQMDNILVFTAYRKLDSPSMTSVNFPNHPSGSWLTSLMVLGSMLILSRPVPSRNSQNPLMSMDCKGFWEW